MKKLQGKFTGLLLALVVLVVGVLCIITGAAEGKASAEAYKNITVVIGVAFIVFAAITVICAFIISCIVRKGFATIALGSAVLLSCGIFFVDNKYIAAQLIIDILAYIPYLLVVTGAIIAVDAVLNLIFNIKNLGAILAAFIVEAIIALVAIVLGALMLGDNPVIDMDVRIIIFGIVVCLSAVSMLLNTLAKKSTIKEQEDAIVAEVVVTEAVAEETTEADAQ